MDVNEIKDKIIIQIKQYTDVHIENEYTHMDLYSELGFNSLQLLKFVIDLEKFCNFDVITASSNEDLTHINTLGDIFNLVTKYQKE